VADRGRRKKNNNNRDVGGWIDRESPGSRRFAIAIDDLRRTRGRGPVALRDALADDILHCKWCFSPQAANRSICTVQKTRDANGGLKSWPERRTRRCDSGKFGRVALTCFGSSRSSLHTHTHTQLASGVMTRSSIKCMDGTIRYTFSNAPQEGFFFFPCHRWVRMDLGRYRPRSIRTDASVSLHRPAQVQDSSLELGAALHFSYPYWLLPSLLCTTCCTCCRSK
jgi:hypothetical protein